VTSPGTIALIIGGVVTLFGGAAAGALIAGLFNRPKVRAEAEAARAASASTGRTSEADAARTIQEAAAAMVDGLHKEMNELRKRVDVGDAWRRAAEELFEQHGQWEREVGVLLRNANITPPVAPPLRPTTLGGRSS
jgi:hypothetical protein